ncbi:DMSO/TMAO reductase YedYZ, molybdopterin-dependent catalytic subunit [Streptomyces sp. DvalAA-14]|uniref:molybdopterin-dependent oxidoreductase n=1 Tax=unclassified Streptomyces TaxID=2593676 RepID=UPI00081B9521|nr:MULTISPECIES: molybdopterin-dependent oxidoreductase [unclassified Streptomyces]MYS24209.1 molybdopterin-dependent oxidoreductase [Streptomyces sp. SID4948]SCE43691.1 DMSO/TMAO reductase YedYZ, molybdopterin-dependent catalytic subunit [Streptomyces sp. DvalAA-14]
MSEQPGGMQGKAVDSSAADPEGEDAQQESGSPTGKRRLAALGGWIARGALVGLVAAGAGLAAGELVAVATGAESSPAVAAGTWAISVTPTWLEQFAIRNFGSNDKLALQTGVYVTVALGAAGLGVLARARLTIASVLTAVFGVVGGIAAVTRPAANTSWLLPSLLAGLVAASVMRWLTTMSLKESAPSAESSGRRRFVLGTLGTAAGALVAGFGGDAWIKKRYDVSAARAKVVLPVPATVLPQPPASVHPDVKGLGSFFTPTSQFYRVDTALAVPRVDPGSWKLKIHGMVDRPFEITFEELLSYRFEEHDMTLTCVSNPVGGPYVGNARWLGTPLAPLLRRAGVRRGADMLLSTSTDGMTIGSPVEAVLDGRQAMLAIAMNGEALPIEHGFPCRMLIPGLYGYVSATKWLTDLDVTTFASSDAYWTPRGYSPQAPVKTASRIDVPATGATVSAGTVVLAGTAWATHRGLAAVEVQIDNGAWREAMLATSDTPDTWRQWSYRWANAPKGSHKVKVRATDGTGTVQTSAVQDVVPNGSTGYHTITVKVS